MSLRPNTNELLARARADLRMGVPVVLHDGSITVLAMAAETASAGRLDDFRALGRVFLALTDRRAETLNIPAYDGDMVRVILPADENLAWLRAVANPADDLRMPMKGPLKALRDTAETAVSRSAILLIKHARLLPAAILVRVTGDMPLQGLTEIDIRSAAPFFQHSSPLTEVASARVPLEVSQAGKVHVFRPDDGGTEHYAVEIGSPDRNKPVLARLHSACFTGDLLHSQKCDCGPQLRAALSQMGKEGAGLLLYLNQEGRGIGLANKMRAYDLQDQGFDTVEANHRLGFEDDERDFRIGARILCALGFSSVRLLTNNPRKVEKMRENGIEVTERVPLLVGRTPQNEEYLKTKARKSGHIL